MQNIVKGTHSKAAKSDATHYASSTNYTPKLKSKGYSG